MNVAAHGPRPAWTVYAAVLTLGVVAGEVFNLRNGPAPGAVTYANWVLSVALLASLWGYALGRPFGTQGYWRAVFWIVLPVNVLMLVPVLLAGGEVAKFALGLELAVLPAYVGAYRYAYRSAELWKAAP